jgi:opacity protein-like surface antigen
LKKILSLLVLVSALYGEAKVYLGTGVGISHEKFDDADYKAKTYNHAKLKIGYGDIDAYAVEFSFDVTQKENANNIYNANDSYGLNIELLKAFNLKSFANPYMKAGFGFGYYKTNDAQAHSMHYGNFILGAGVFIPFSEHYDLQLGYEYKTISYEKAQGTTKNINATANIGYVGINVRF